MTDIDAMATRFAELYMAQLEERGQCIVAKADIERLEAEAQALREEVAALRARVVVPDEVMRALEDARKFVDAAFYVGLCEHSASRELYRDGTYTLAEHRDAKKNLKEALESAEEAEIALLCSPLFVGESLYPASAEEMQARLNGKAVSEGLLRRIEQMLQVYFEYLCDESAEEVDITMAAEARDELRTILHP